MQRITNIDFRKNHLAAAIFCAVMLHVFLAIFIPNLPKLTLQGIDRPSGLTVFLANIKEEPFDQFLNQQLPLPANIEALSDPSLGSTSEEIGEDAIVSNAVEPAQASNYAVEDLSSAGFDAQGDSKPSLRFDYATVRLFAEREAARYAQLHPREVARFDRTFNRSRNYRRRSRIASYQDRLGDLYARSNSSSGDVCFKQQRVETPDEFTTNTVYFFRCDKQPQGFELDSLPNG